MRNAGLSMGQKEPSAACTPTPYHVGASVSLNRHWPQSFSPANGILLRLSCCFRVSSSRKLSLLFRFFVFSKGTLVATRRFKRSENEQIIRTRKTESSSSKSVGLYRKCKCCSAPMYCCLCLV